MEMEMGRRSEFKDISVDQETDSASCARINEMSGEEGLPFEGRQVGESKIRIKKFLFSICCRRTSPQASLKFENHAGECALTSPTMRASSFVSSNLLRSGLYLVLAETGGM
jgi:hypothetical protein